MTGSWQTKTLGEVATLQRGFDLPTRERVAGEFPLVSSSGIVDTHHKGVVRGPGVVTGRSGSIGSVFFVEHDFWPLNTTLYVKDFHGNDPRFVFHLLKHFNLERFASGAGVPTLNRNFVHNKMVRVPPLPAQRRIARILDETFDSIAIAKANSTKNLENVRALFESELQTVITQRSKEWEERRLGEIAEFKNGLNFNQASNGQSVRMVGVGHFQNNYIVPMSELSSVTIDGTLDNEYKLRKNDILTVRSNGSRDLVGRCMLVPAVEGAVSYSGFTIRIRLRLNAVAPSFLLHFMRSSETRLRLTRDGGGANISNINQRKLSSLVVPLPSLEVQHVLVDKLERMREKGERLEGIYQRKVEALEALKKSLAHEAFSGQL